MLDTSNQHLLTTTPSYSYTKIFTQKTNKLFSFKHEQWLSIIWVACSSEKGIRICLQKELEPWASKRLGIGGIGNYLIESISLCTGMLRPFVLICTLLHHNRPTDTVFL